YKRAEILVLPSLSEAFGNVLNEAGAYGVVRISTPTAGALEILRDEVDALIAKDFSPQALSRVIIKAIKDENLRVNLVKNINLYRFLAENIALKWEELIKELKGQ
ncbi:glycosyltransferase, partial [Campylobacter lanienae]